MADESVAFHSLEHHCSKSPQQHSDFRAMQSSACTVDSRARCCWEMLACEILYQLCYNTVKYAHNFQPVLQIRLLTLLTGYSAALDFILVFISTTIVWNLKLSVSRRIQLAALLGTGIL